MTAVVRTAFRVLTFRVTRDELLALDGRHLAFGLGCTWLVGMGRYWDDPRSTFLQHLGVGSFVYVFALSLLLFLLIWPLNPPNWSYRRLLTFITLVSPPAALYAIPVERIVRLDTARVVNAWFLAIVALWRVSLLFFYLKRFALFRWHQIVVVGLLPLTAIVTTLFALNLEHVVFDIMGGIRNPSPNDTAYEVLFVLTMLSFFVFVPLLLGYIVLVFVGRRLRKDARAQMGP
jgi:hypothetical protein